jgi:hypothetical protein
MSFLYPRTVSVRRAPRKSGVGVQAYRAALVSEEVTIA